MKKTIIILIALAAIFATCRKEDRDEAFKSRTHRYLTGGWEINKIIINGIDSTSLLINNDTMVKNFYFKYNPDHGDVTYHFTSYSKLYRKDGSWQLKNNKIVYIDLLHRYNFINGDTILNRWIEEGDWEIKEIKRDKLELHFKNNVIEYEYSFIKILES